MKNILVTGGAGYIGSHTVTELLSRGYAVTICDNLCNSSAAVLDRINQITGVRPRLENIDLRDLHAVTRLCKAQDFDAVIHFAGLKAVGESVEQPLLYYDNNVSGTINLLRALEATRCRQIVFSSSATVYGEANSVPITEGAPLVATSPYGQTKLTVEYLLRDVAMADKDWRISLLRYFNPVGAHPSGLIGEHPSGVPNNLVPYIAQVGVGKHPRLRVFGDDYPTLDGTGVRDYVHVVDLAEAHVHAVENNTLDYTCRAFNIGTGRGYSVLEVVKAFEAASGAEIPYEILPRRSGDVAVCYAEVSRAKNELDWAAQRGLAEMMQDHWNWQFKNPDGY